MRTVCGLDVHKDSVFMCILGESGEKIEEKYSTLTPDLDRMRDLMVTHHVGEVAMESTSIYWVPIWRILESDFSLKLVNPLFIKQLPGRKTDIKDAHWIALVLQKELIRGSYVPEHEIQELRLIERRQADLRKKGVRVLQRIDNILQRCNIRLSNYVSDVESKSMLKVIDAIIAGERDGKKLARLVHGRTKNKHGTSIIESSLSGYITTSVVFNLKQLTEELFLLRKHEDECLKEMERMCSELYAAQVEHLDTIPGIAKQSAMTIVAELGVNLEMFATASALVGWLGLRPRNEESAGKIKSKKTMHGNKYLRLILVQCAWAAIREKDSRFKTKYNLLKKRMNKHKALIAIARKLVLVIWNVLTKNEVYNPLLGHKRFPMVN
jgi:Transposase and inactivated derivatives